MTKGELIKEIKSNRCYDANCMVEVYMSDSVDRLRYWTDIKMHSSDIKYIGDISEIPNGDYELLDVKVLDYDNYCAFINGEEPDDWEDNCEINIVLIAQID